MLEAPESDMINTQLFTTLPDRAEGTPYTSVKVTSERASDRQRTRQPDIHRSPKNEGSKPRGYPGICWTFLCPREWTELSGTIGTF